MIHMETVCVIETSNQDIVNMVLKDVVKYLKVKLRGIERLVKIQAKTLITEALENSPVYKALLNNGELRTELGVVKPSTDLKGITKLLIDGIQVTPLQLDILNNNISGEMTVTAVPKDFGLLLSSGLGTYTSINKSGEQTEIPWLRWLLTTGSQPVIVGYRIKYNMPEFSRTKNAIMVEKTGGEWFVPAEYQGTLQDNFITRALNNAQVNERLGMFIVAELKRRFG